MDTPTPDAAGRFRRNWDAVRTLWRPTPPDWEAELADLRAKAPAPVFWLFGKTQSGKTSLVRYLTGAEDAEIGSGFRPCTRTSRVYPFPTADAPVLTFLDTRGVDEPGYDPAEDLKLFDPQAHVVIVTCRLTDFAHGHLRDALKTIRKANPKRPVLLALTCLHESYPQTQHPEPYPFDPAGAVPQLVGDADKLPPDLIRLVREQAGQFAGLADHIVPIDLTRVEEGFADPFYGGPALKALLLATLPAAYRTTFARVSELSDPLKALHLKHAMPLILGYATLASAAGAIPVPFLDLLLLPAIQARMVHKLATVYGEPLTAEHFLDAVKALGLGLVARQAAREVVKFIPFVGVPAGAALAGESTYALGLAFCEYYQQAHAGHVPGPETLKKLYREQLSAAAHAWSR